MEVFAQNFSKIGANVRLDSVDVTVKNVSERHKKWYFVTKIVLIYCDCSKGQLISKCLFGVFNFFQKRPEVS